MLGLFVGFFCWLLYLWAPGMWWLWLLLFFTVLVRGQVLAVFPVFLVLDFFNKLIVIIVADEFIKKHYGHIALASSKYYDFIEWCSEVLGIADARFMSWFSIPILITIPILVINIVLWAFSVNITKISLISLFTDGGYYPEYITREKRKSWKRAIKEKRQREDAIRKQIRKNKKLGIPVDSIAIHNQRNADRIVPRYQEKNSNNDKPFYY